MATDFGRPGGRGDGPNLEQTLASLRNAFNRLGRGRRAWPYIAALVLVLWLLTGIYIVNPDELGVTRRLGKMNEIADPGIHFRIPWPVDRVDIAKVAQIRSMDLGFRAAGERSIEGVRPIPTESLMITGDTNLVNIQVVVQYRISDLPAYLFKVWDPEGSPEGRTLRDASESALRGVVGSMTIDDILTVGRAKVQDETKVHLQQLMDNYSTGLLITEVKLQAVEPPEPVQAAFKDVVSAKEDGERIINEARAYSEDVLPKARGEAEQMLRAAEGYKESRVREAQGDSARFLSMLKEYREAKEVTRRRLFLETMSEVLAKAEKTIISAELGGKMLPLLPLGNVPGLPSNPRREEE